MNTGFRKKRKKEKRNKEWGKVQKKKEKIKIRMVKRWKNIQKNHANNNWF